MSRIFGGARRVLVWLGPSDSLVDDLMRRVHVYEPHEERAGVEDACERPYWHRLWVFQELKSAKDITIMCGSHELRWNNFKDILDRATTRIDFMERGTVQEQDPDMRWMSGHTKLSAATRMIYLCRDTAPTSLWLLLQLTSHLDCYDPRDKVYTLLSMAKTGSEGIDPDYEIPLPHLMHRVLSNSYAIHQPRSAHDVNVRCARLKAMMGLGQDFPWGADDYFAAEGVAPTSTRPL